MSSMISAEPQTICSCCYIHVVDPLLQCRGHPSKHMHLLWMQGHRCWDAELACHNCEAAYSSCCQFSPHHSSTITWLKCRCGALVQNMRLDNAAKLRLAALLRQYLECRTPVTSSSTRRMPSLGASG